MNHKKMNQMTLLLVGIFYSISAFSGTEIDFNLKEAKRFAKGEMLRAERSKVESKEMHPYHVYDLSQNNGDWSKGYTTLFIGTRKESVERADYQESIVKHILDVRRDFANYGLVGYIAYIDQDFEIAWQNWKDKSSSERAFQSEAGQIIVRDATSFMDSAFFQEMKSSKK